MKTNNMRGLRNYILFAVLGFFLALPAGAQVLTQTDPLRIVVSPEIPTPGQTVRVEVQGVGLFLGDATITWQVNGATAKQGLGERTHTLVAGALGSATRVRITVNSATEGTLVRNVTITPSLVNLVWEANTYTPPLFRGKALYTPGARITVVAFPQIVRNGRTVAYNNLSFQWSRNGTNATAQSGQGRNSFSFTGDQLRSLEQISVDVYYAGEVAGKGSVAIPASEPAIVLYPRDPLQGVLWGQALPSAISLASREITVQAEPFYFSRESLENGSLTYQWKLNNRTTTGPEAARGRLTLRQTGEGSGSATVGVELQNLDNTRILQAAEAVVRIVFGAQQSGGGGFSSFFGL